MKDAARPAEPVAHLGRQVKLWLLALPLTVFGSFPLGYFEQIGKGNSWYIVAAAIAAALIYMGLAWGLRAHPYLMVRLAAWLALLAGFVTCVESLRAIWSGAVTDADNHGLLVFGSVGVACCAMGLARFRLMAPPRDVKLSAAIICKDEVDRLEPCLQALAGWADEIVVLDSGSTDGTQALARRYTDKVFETDWPGYGPQKQRALEQCTGEWVLSLDADEVISADLKREIDAHLAGPTRYTAFRFPWVSVIFGGPIHFGADGRYHTRLFRRDAARFDAAQVHEEAVVQGRVGTLWAPVYHFTFRDFAHLKQKFAEYAWLSAKSRHAKGRSVTAVGAVLRGCASFLLLYFVRLGVLDGRRGLLMAVLYAHYTFDKYAGLWALNRSASRRDA